MATIRGDILIERPVDEVFDFVADEANEPSYNSQMLRSVKLTEGPVGRGTRFRSTIRTRRGETDVFVEHAEFDPPRRLRVLTDAPGLRVDGILTFEPVGSATRMRWEWTPQPQGWLRLLSPVVAEIGRRQERRVWESMRQHLEQRAPAGR